MRAAYLIVHERLDAADNDIMQLALPVDGRQEGDTAQTARKVDAVVTSTARCLHALYETIAQYKLKAVYRPTKLTCNRTAQCTSQHGWPVRTPSIRSKATYAHAYLTMLLSADAEDVGPWSTPMSVVSKQSAAQHN